MPPRRHDRSCSIRGCTAEFYALDLCKRHYYRLERHNNPTAFQIARKYDKFDAQGNRWCTGHRTWVPPSQFGVGPKNRCRTCRRIEKYKITLEEFVAMEAATSGLCPICMKRPMDVIDHDHISGVVRGLLCRQCNIAIGTITEEGIARAMAYLNQHGGRTLNEATA